MSKDTFLKTADIGDWTTDYDHDRDPESESSTVTAYNAVPACSTKASPDTPQAESDADAAAESETNSMSLHCCKTILSEDPDVVEGASANLVNLIERSITEILKYVSELKQLNDALNELEKDAKFTSQDPHKGFEIENLKQAFREVVILSHRFIADSKSLAKYASSVEQMQQIERDLAASSAQSIKPFLEGIITNIRRCHVRLKQHQSEYKKLAEKVHNFLSPFEPEHVDVEDQYVLVSTPKPNNEGMEINHSSISSHLTGWVTSKLSGLSYAIASSVNMRLFSNNYAASSMDAMPYRKIQSIECKLEEVHKLIIQHLEYITSFCEAFSKVEEDLREVNYSTVTLEQIHCIDSRMKDILKVTP